MSMSLNKRLTPIMNTTDNFEQGREKLVITTWLLYYSNSRRERVSMWNHYPPGPHKHIGYTTMEQQHGRSKSEQLFNQRQSVSKQSRYK